MSSYSHFFSNTLIYYLFFGTILSGLLLFVLLTFLLLPTFGTPVKSIIIIIIIIIPPGGAFDVTVTIVGFPQSLEMKIHNIFFLKTN